jgi:hypothetical protein
VPTSTALEGVCEMPIEGIRFLEVNEMTGVRHHDERGRRD